MKDVLDANRLRTVGLPGLILALALHPFIARWTTAGSSVYGLSTTVVFIAEVILFGLVVSSAGRAVYYVYEGFRLSPLTALPRRWNRRMTATWRNRQVELYGERTVEQLSWAERLEAIRVNELLSDYFFDNDGVPLRPTRLGNIIATYERYPEERYGVNGIEYWHHILSFAPEHLRKQLEDHISLAQSLVLASSCAIAVIAVGATLLIGLALGQVWPLLDVPLGWRHGVLYVALGLLAWVVFYRLAIGAHRELRSVFRATVDLSIAKFIAWVRDVEVPLKETDLAKAREVWYFLSFGERPPDASPTS